jgi:hypothetical protein
MKTETRAMFVARDGGEFKTAALCRAHERKTAGASLVGLSAARVLAAQSGEDPELAEAFVDFVNEMRNATRRRPNGPEPAGNNAGDNRAPILSDHAGSGSGHDSTERTESEQAI